jgi:diguanylate cyclase (GGDEF)-like protein/PAS domain S-box-containing protein
MHAMQGSNESSATAKAPKQLSQRVGVAGSSETIATWTSNLPSRSELSIGAVYFLAVLLVGFAMRAPLGGPAWPANGIAIGLLFQLRTVRSIHCAATLFVVGTAALYLTVDHSLGYSAALMVVNLCEIFTAASLVRARFEPGLPELPVRTGVYLTLLSACAAPTIFAVPGAMLLHAQFGAPLWPAAAKWWTSHVLGACLFSPPIYLFDAKQTRKLLDLQFLSRNLLLTVVTVANCYGAVRYLDSPYLFISVPLIVAGLQLGALGSAFLSVLSNAMVLGLWSAGIGSPQFAADPLAGLMGDLHVAGLLATTLLPNAIGVATDQRRRAMQAVRQHEQQLRLTLDSSPIGTVISDLNGRWIRSNPALQRLLGYSAEELLGKRAADFAHPDEFEHLVRRRAKLSAGEIEPRETNRRFRHKNGSYIRLRVTGGVIRDSQGQPQYFIGHMISAEARERAERELAEERELLKITLQSITDAIITTGADSRITQANAAATDLVGQEFESVEGRRLEDIVVLTDPKTSRTVPSMFAKCIATAEVVQRDEPCVMYLPNGNARYVREIVSPVTDVMGKLIGTVVVIRDATENYHRERELNHRATHDPLTGLVNRFEFERHASEVFKRARQLVLPATLLVIDLDRFKGVNDAGGHAAGDAILRRVAAALRSAVRETDTVARTGGDEFAILLERCTKARAQSVSRQLLATLNPLQIDWSGTKYSVGASMGAATISAQYGSVAAWMAAADQACYEAKRSGRGELCLAQEVGPVEQS